mgnify:CR=1 FL=1
MSLSGSKIEKLQRVFGVLSFICTAICIATIFVLIFVSYPQLVADVQALPKEEGMSAGIVYIVIIVFCWPVSCGIFLINSIISIIMGCEYFKASKKSKKINLCALIIDFLLKVISAYLCLFLSKTMIRSTDVPLFVLSMCMWVIAVVPLTNIFLQHIIKKKTN